MIGLPSHQILRDATAPLHDSVDRIFAGFNLQDTRSYLGFLRAHAAAVLAIEDALDARGMTEQLPDWPLRSRRTAILDDLACLDSPLTWRSIAPDIRSDGAPWGAAYVLEGSRLGGRVLARRIRAGLPRTYLSGSDAQSGWKSFLTRLDAALHSSTLRDHAVTAAIETFGIFETAGKRELEAMRHE